LQEVVIYGVSFDMVGKQPIVLLKTVESNKFLPIWIGHPEAAAILMKLQGASTPRPMTHDLLSDVLGELEVECTKVAVTELRENTFYASISLRANGRELEIDSRPSDALALAVRSGAPIFAADEVITESAIEFEHEVEDTEEVVEKFKDFLDTETATIKPAITALKPLVPQIGDLLTKLIALLSQLKVAVTALSGVSHGEHHLTEQGDDLVAATIGAQPSGHALHCLADLVKIEDLGPARTPDERPSPMLNSDEAGGF